MAEKIVFEGCSPVPLADYLKALAILRLVGEQSDEDALGYWRGEHFVLESSLDKERLVDFFLSEYRPTPIVAPWNGGSGFFPKDRQKGIAAIENSNCVRLETYREVIGFGRGLVRKLRLEKKPSGDLKEKLLKQVRAEGPEKLLSWLDAAIVLTDEALKFPPLLGTGGNDGRLDFTNNFMQHVIAVMPLDERESIPESSRGWLLSSLFKVAAPDVGVKAPIGQFDPGSAGGPNATTGFEGDSLINPWDYILMMEGSLLFAATTTRRLEKVGPSALSYPFTVRPTTAGMADASKDEEKNSRAEIWVPLWRNPTSYMELFSLFREGRVTLRRRIVADGLDFIRAIASLGVDSGFTSFQRYSFMERSGKAYLATPSGRIVVRRVSEADLVADLDKYGFLQRLRAFAGNDNAPGRIKLLARRLENGIFSLAQHTSREQFLNLLVILGDIQRTIGTSRECREKIHLVPLLSEEWVTSAFDGSPEFRLACSLAGIETQGKLSMPMRAHLAPVDPRSNMWAEESDESELLAWKEGRLTANMVRVARKRYLVTKKAELEEKPFRFRYGADLPDIAAFLNGSTNDSRIDALLQGLALCKMPRRLEERKGEHDSSWLSPPSVYSILKPFFVPDEILKRIGFLPEDSCLPLPAEIMGLLSSSQVDRALVAAWMRLRYAGVSLPEKPNTPPRNIDFDGERLLAALIFPVGTKGLSESLKRIEMPRDKAKAVN